MKTNKTHCIRVICDNRWLYVNTYIMASKSELYEKEYYDIDTFLLDKKEAIELFNSLKINRASEFDSITLLTATTKYDTIIERAVIEYYGK